MLIISGDLFDGVPTLSELKEVNYLFSLIPETKVVLCAGNHDYISKENPYPEFDWSENVTGLWSEKCESVSLKKLNTRVYGLSYHHYEAARDLYKGVQAHGDEKYHILLFHGGDALHSPANKAGLSAAGFDYIAMGHIHKPGFFIKNKAAYCGALEPIDCSDTSSHGYLEVHLNERKGCSVKFVRFASVKYETIEIEAAELTLLEVQDVLRREVLKRGDKNSYRLVINNGSKAFEVLKPESLWKIGRFIEVTRDFESRIDIDALKKEYPGTFLEEYINALYDRSDEAGRAALIKGVKVILNAMETGL